MWSRPIRIARENRRRWSGSSSASSHTADAWVMVTSLSTPSPATMMPHEHHRGQRQIGRGRGQHVVVLRGDPGQVGPAASPRTPTGRSVISPKRVPTSAVDVRAEKPWAAYRTTNMIADEPIRPDQRSGSMPADQRREHELDQDEAGEAETEQRGEPAPARDRRSPPRRTAGRSRAAGPSLEVGELVLRRLTVDRRDPDQGDPLADLDAARVERVGERDRSTSLPVSSPSSTRTVTLAQVCRRHRAWSRPCPRRRPAGWP